MKTGSSKLARKLRKSALWKKIRRRKATVISLVLAISHILGALTSIHAIMQTRTSQGAIAWAVSLNTIPYLTVPAYWVLGRSKFQDYYMERQEAFEATNPVTSLIRSKYIEGGLITQPDRETAFLLEKLARLPFTNFNQVDLLIDGEEKFASLFQSIKQAKEYILIQYYIVRDDAIGRELRDLLIDRARAGVRVFFLYDEIGSNALPDSYIRSLKEGGICVGPFNSTKGKANRFQLNFRNHRKIVVVDGREAYIGGINVGDEYLGRDAQIGNWRDTHVKINGPAVEFAQLSFIEDWRWATGELLKVSWEPEKSTSGTKDVLCMPSGPADPFETCTLFFLAVINEAKSRLWIATPYFVPDEQIMSALKLAALRGVDVRIIVPRNNDSRIVSFAILSYLEECERAGIKVLQYDNGFMHQKVLIMDEDLAAIGTANFDNRSFRLNFEITAVVRDEQFTSNVVEMLQHDQTYCSPLPASDVTSASLPFRFAVRAARLFAPVL